MKVLLKICGIITGIGGALGILWVAFKFADKYIDPPVTKEEVKEIVTTEIIPLRDDILFQWDFMNDILFNQDKLQKMVLNHFANDSSVTKTDIVNMTNEFKNEIKKKSNPIRLTPKDIVIKGSLE